GGSPRTGPRTRPSRPTRPVSPALRLCAARTRRTLSANCGSTVTATTSAVPISQSAGGTDRSGRVPDLEERGAPRPRQPLGVRERVRGAYADHDRGEPEPVVQPRQQGLA